MLQGMSGLCIYEFEDVAWDEFCQSADHIAPDSRRPNDQFSLGDNNKKRPFEITSTSSSNGDGFAARYVDQEREQGEYVTLMSKRRNMMLEKETYNGVHSSVSNGDPIKEPSSLASDNTRSSSHGFRSTNADSNDSEICENDAIGDKSDTVDNNSFSCPLPDITHTGNNLDFFDNADNKDSTDFLHYGWPEIGNFEDIDGMLRGCDSPFGLGGSKEDELGWFSSADDIGDVLKSDFKFPCLEPNMMKNISGDHNSSKDYSINGSAITSAPIRSEDTSSTSENSDMYMSFAIGHPIADSKDGLIPEEQGVDFNCKIQRGIPANSLPRTVNAAMINEHKKQFKLKSQSDGKSKEDYLTNGSFNHVSNLPNEVMQLPSEHTSHQAFASVRMQQNEHTPSPDSYFYLKNPISCVHSDDSYLSDPSLVNPTVCTVKSEPNDLTSPSSRPSTRGSSQLQSVESSYEPPFQVTARAGYEKGETLHNHRGIRSLNSSLKNAGAMVQTSICDPGSEGKLENHSDAEGVSLAMLSELGSSNVQGRTRSSGLDDISIEATGFRQLQLVMEQLDLKTKLCIRDSLYRLARSAELRHNHANGSCGDERDANGSFMAEGTNKCTSFMDIETDTNPIDRSIAHLLFHRSSDSSPTPGTQVCTKSACNG